MEQAKYERLWREVPAYRAVAPGEHYVDDFITRANPQGRVIDFGTGTGRGALRIAQMTGARVLALDFVDGCMDPEVQASGLVEFRQHDLTQPVGEVADYGYCTDVLEHIPPEDVPRVLTNIFAAARRVYLCISTVDDVMGAMIGEPLHLTVENLEWWTKTLEGLGIRIDHSRDLGEAVVFYGSIYANGDDYSKVTGMNAPDERIRDNIRKNLALELQEVCPHEVQETHICLLAGGPSLADHEAEIVERGRRGEIFVTVNGTYKWLLDRGIKPAAQFMVDAREFNERFVDPIVDTCRYVFSSQAAHEAVVKVPKEQAWLYHSGETPIVRECFDAHCEATGTQREWYPVYGGTTVVGRALVALAMLGFRNIEVIGWDSCLRDGEHHAYAQPENDGAHVVEMEVGGKRFQCHPWMVVQANELPKLVRYLFGPIQDFNLNVRGDGLIAHMLNHAADLAGKGK